MVRFKVISKKPKVTFKAIDNPFRDDKPDLQKSDPMKEKKKQAKKATKKKTAKSERQIPKSRKSIKADRQRKAKRPGKRRSADGNTYTERRQNRSDKKGTRL